MAQLPKQVSEAVRRLNPEIYGKEVGNTENATDKRTPEHMQLRTVSEPGDAVTTGGAKSEQNTRQFTIHTDPVPAPRMTRSDKWRGLPGSKMPRRPRVQRYFDYRDTLQKSVGDIPIVPDEIHAVFHFPMPDSWTKKRRQEMIGQPHRQRPDGDNCTKAIQDALFLEDGSVWKGSFEKRWAIHGRVELTMIWQRESP